MEDCIFCKIIAGEIPSTTVYEDEVVKAFLDITQVTPGHTIKAANPEVVGLNLVNNNGQAAYQSVFHSHFHLIPRFGAEDGFAMKFTDNSANYTPTDLALIAKSIETKVEK